MERIKGGVTAAKGFLANSLKCGIKRSGPDLALLFSKVPAVAFALFTQNKVKAAPVIVSQRHIKNPACRAVIVNSGNANCCTGAKGIKDAEAMAASAAGALRVSKGKILVASTGVIGKVLPAKLIKEAIPDLIKGLNKRGSHSFARAIMTTDRFPKEVALKIKIGNTTVIIGGVAKGAGMIYPNMATTLSFVTTDARIKRSALKDAFKKAVDASFNSISIDGATSTNDCAFILASGLAGNKTISKGSSAYIKFCRALGYVMAELAKMIVLDGEGATKLIHIAVKNARSYDDAKKAATSVANNPLFKTSVYGQDPNWGRIVAAVGSSGAKILLNRLDIYLDGKKVLSNGVKANVDKRTLRKIYRRKDVYVVVDLKLGSKASEILTCDLTRKYIDINSKYTT